MTSLRKILKPLDGGVISVVGAGGKTTLIFRLAREIAVAGETVLTTTTTKILMPRVDQSPHVIVSRNVTDALKQAQTLVEKDTHLTAVKGSLSSQGKLVGFTTEEIYELKQSGAFRWIIVEADGARRRPIKAPADHEPVIPASSSLVIIVIGLDAVGSPLNEDTVFRSPIFAEITGLKPGENITEHAVATALIHDRGMMKGIPPGALRYVFLNKAETKARLAAGRRIVRFLGETGGRRPNLVIIGSLREGNIEICHLEHP